VAFSVTSCKRGGFLREETWQVTGNSVHWADIFTIPSGHDRYDEGAFRRLAALNGWRLIQVVPVNARERRLYFRRIFDPRRAPDN
jgi:hypothetical protein